MSWKAKCGKFVSGHAPRAWLALQIARRDRHFEPEYWLLPRLTRRDANSVDVGGNAGQYAYYLSRLTRAVHVFEPNPICLAQLARVRRGNMIVHDVALSDHHGEATMRFDPNNTGVGTIEGANRLDRNPGITSVVERRVKICPLDDLHLENVAFIKIDVEGHEPSVLRGAVNLIGRDKPVLLIEIERRHNSVAFNQVDDLLASVGYRAWRLSQGVLIPVRGDEIDRLQPLPLTQGQEYVNNFIFLPAERLPSFSGLTNYP
ncbi:MAG TPA: FkbM family methyltransferase [Acidobacteriaceae bacterium]|nr:FkbM family methyltransferase [Acidobacteriaceae bacterium]